MHSLHDRNLGCLLKHNHTAHTDRDLLSEDICSQSGMTVHTMILTFMLSCTHSIPAASFANVWMVVAIAQFPFASMMSISMQLREQYYVPVATGVVHFEK